jgi:hypothetical protein
LALLYPTPLCFSSHPNPTPALQGVTSIDFSPPPLRVKSLSDTMSLLDVFCHFALAVECYTVLYQYLFKDCG